MFRLALQTFRQTRRASPRFYTSSIRFSLRNQSPLLLYSTAPSAQGVYTSSGLHFWYRRWQSYQAVLPQLRSGWKEFVGTNTNKVKDKWERFESHVVAVVSGLSLSATGPKVLGLLLPPVVTAWLYPLRFSCFAHDGSPTYTIGTPYQQLQHVRRDSYVQQAFKQLLDEVMLSLRALYLMALFLPAVLSAPVVFYTQYGRSTWMHLMKLTLERAGPAFIKWGQWASTRPDLFPQDLCTALEQLQTGAPTHPAAYSRSAISSAFDRPVDQLFTEFDDEPVASGSIAQIHRAVLSEDGARGTKYRPGTVVAVKVRHPSVTTLMERDFTLMTRTAELLGKLPMLSELRLDDSLQQFGGPLRDQLNLKAEAANLARFNHNFRLWSSVSFPRPIFPLVESDVLVETFEEGDLISCYVKTPGYKFNEKIAETGMQLYLQMLLKDNFIHADLHPGNILVKEVDPKSFLGFFANFLNFQPQLILLDTGMIAELSRADQKSVLALFKALTKQDGEKVANSILSMADPADKSDHTAFVADMKDMFDRLDPETIRKYTSDVLREMIETIRQHHVMLRGCVSTVVVTTLVLEGWSSKLHPDIRILDTIKDMLAADWSDRISLSVDKIMSSGSLAVL